MLLVSKLCLKIMTLVTLRVIHSWPREKSLSVCTCIYEYILFVKANDTSNRRYFIPTNDLATLTFLPNIKGLDKTFTTGVTCH